MSGEYEQNWKVAVGDAADAEVRHSKEISRQFMADQETYRQRHDDYLARLRAMSTRIEELKAAKQDFSALKRQMDSLPPPPEPQQPRDYIVPPVDVQGAFVVNLPPGRYRVRLLNQDAQVLEGSEKWIVSHVARRMNGVGYEVIPSDKWTRPEESKELSSILYVNGKADLYVTPFFEHEYNDLDYAQTTDNGASGNPRVYSWNRIQQVPHAVLLFRGSGAGPGATRLSEQPFYVQQTAGAGLGYTIVPFTGSGDQEGKEANLRAFRLPVQAGSGQFEVRALDEDGNFLPGSERRILIVAPGRGTAILFFMTLAPLVVMIVVLILRMRLYAGKRFRKENGTTRL